MRGGGVVCRIVKKVGYVLNGVAAPVQRFLIHAFTRNRLDQLDLRVTRIREIEVADPVPGFSEGGAITGFVTFEPPSRCAFKHSDPTFLSTD